MPASFRCCFSSESPSQARISHSNRRSGTASWSCQATIWPTDSQGRYGSPSALEPPSTTIRYSSGGDGSNVVGSAGSRCIQPRQAAEPSSRTTSETRHARQTARPRSIPRPDLPPFRRRDRAASADRERRPDHCGQGERPVSDQHASQRRLDQRSAATPRGSTGIQPGSTIAQRHQDGDRHRHGGQPQSPRRSASIADRARGPAPSSAVVGLGGRGFSAHGSGQPGRAEDVLARELQAGEQPRPVDGRGLDRALDPTIPHASHHHHAPCRGRRRSSIPWRRAAGIPRASPRSRASASWGRRSR